jgi:threonine dehydrogenase-like Zn-dependent dehydrogenase
VVCHFSELFLWLQEEQVDPTVSTVATSELDEVEKTMTMRAVIFKGPYKVTVEDRPIPLVQEPTDIVVRTKLSALCGSDLHVYHGHDSIGETDFCLGHEHLGTVHEVGSSIKNFKKGDLVVSPFTVSCGDCFFCSRDQTARCVHSKVFGSTALDGAQAEYVRVPLADTTLYYVPKGADPETILLMADIFPTGYFVANNAFKMLDEKGRQDVSCVVVGCGPVGLCAITSATHFFKVSVTSNTLGREADFLSRRVSMPSTASLIDWKKPRSMAQRKYSI